MRTLLGLRLGRPGAVAAITPARLAPVAWASRVLARFEQITDVETQSRRSLRTDLGYLVLSPITEAFASMLTMGTIAGCAVATDGRLAPDLRGFGPVMEQPRWLVIIEMLCLGDLIFYWTHRLAHTVPWLWRLHAVHHSTKHLRWTSAVRAHPAEAYAHLFHVLPLCLLGFPVDGLAPLLPVVTLYAFLIHSNLDVSLRPLSYLLNSPAYHRWHHARGVPPGGTNFAGLFPIFDVIFGTYHLPERAPRDLGIDDPVMPDTCLAQLAYPFRGREREVRADGEAVACRVPAILAESRSPGRCRIVRNAAYIALSCLVLGCGTASDGAIDAALPDAEASGSVLVEGGDAAVIDGGDETMSSIDEREFDAGSDPARNAVRPGELCERLAQIQCAAEASCCDGPGRDRATCEARQFELCANEWYLDAISLDPLSGFDEARAATALAHIERLAETCDPHVAAYEISTEGLRGTFAGSRPPGSDCGPPMDTPIYQLDPARVAIELASCGSIEATACLPTESILSGGWTCAPRGDIGAPCLTHFNCMDGLSCPNASASSFVFSLAICAARNPAGTSCNANGECMSLACVAGTCAATDDIQAAYCFARR